MKKRTPPLNITWTWIWTSVTHRLVMKKREGVFFFSPSEGTPCWRYMHSFILHPQKIIKNKIMKVGFLVVSEGSLPTPSPPKRKHQEISPNFFDANFLAVRHSEARGEEHVGGAKGGCFESYSPEKLNMTGHE